MGEKRNLEGIRYLYIGAIIINAVLNLFYYLRGYGIDLGVNLQIDLETIVRTSYFILSFLLIVAVMSFKIEIAEEDIERLNSKMKFMYILNMFFISYIIITLVLVEDRNIRLSAIVMEIMFIGITIITRKIITLGLTNRQLKWRQAIGAEAECKESNFTWRWKIWISPHVKVPFTRRWKGPMRFLYDLVLIYFIYYSPRSFVILIFLLLPDVISWIEGLFGLHTSLTGKCTGIVEKSRRNDLSKYYVIYVTDFENEREVKFVVENNNFYIRESMNLTVVHGVFSKRVMYVEGLSMDIR